MLLAYEHLLLGCFAHSGGGKRTKGLREAVKPTNNDYVESSRFFILSGVGLSSQTVYCTYRGDHRCCNPWHIHVSSGVNLIGCTVGSIWTPSRPWWWPPTLPCQGSSFVSFIFICLHTNVTMRGKKSLTAKGNSGQVITHWLRRLQNL